MAKYIYRQLSSKVEITTRSASDNAFPSMPQFALNADSGFDIIDVKRDFKVEGYYWSDEPDYMWSFNLPFNDVDTTDPMFVYDGVTPEFDRYAEASYLWLDLVVEFYQELPLPMTIAKAQKYAKDNGVEALWALCLEGNTPKIVPNTIVVNEPYSKVLGVIDEEWETHTSYVGDVSPIGQVDHDLFDLVRTTTSNFNYHFVGGMKVDR